MLSLRRRILLTVTPLMLLLLAIGGTGIWLLARLGEQGEAILRENYDSVRAMNRLEMALHELRRITEIASQSTGNERPSVDSIWNEINQQLQIESNNLTIYPDEPRLVQQLEAAVNRLSLQDADFAKLGSREARRAAFQGRDRQAGWLVSWQSAVERVQEIRDLNESTMHETSRRAKEMGRVSVWGLFLALGTALLLGAVAVWWLLRVILGPIQSLTEAVTAIGGGQLHCIIPESQRDEIGELATAFNAMTAKLRAYRQTHMERLMRARETAQATIDSFTDPVIVMDPLGRVEVANPTAQQLLGVRPPTDQEQPAQWVPPESLHAAIDTAFREQREIPATGFDQAVSFRQSGEDRLFLPQIRPIRSPDSELLGVAIVLHDITRFRLMDQLKSDWVATVSHELKTPLTSVRLAVHVLLEEVVGPLEPKQIELLIEARDNTERLLRLIEHLLALAKLEDGREQLDRQPMTPGELLQLAADEAASRAEDKHLSLVVNDPGELPMVLVDREKMARALNNLLDNALAYTDSGGTITLSASRGATGTIQVAVSDTGIGIPEEYLPHVFERFFRVPDRVTTPGTGLGLAIVREVITAHQGDIRCISTPGQGTTFLITLPTWPEGA
ncbi:multi-sensor signal transduction histidine kinase : Histidine kinase OS=Singulisphaera acidiphila (strain ATCC BAA-1392 / DSM 18658 / VKM B-2454 / MOB10) GN=Sinac_5540 PE=4 SV=1: HAMP: PAS_9: HisKA: HATPase_c [Tuwongella immobilis]|uniref:histidine kinase n=2 Tax=Tuwongella immobilis TaxID=692036 RepID=A0A6C2YS03_9BACT|nr:multi-sensor signal transduction histidine kinase : Histidine kinase OS=Singulisphaera acidiphila (strain ATCC BAA-1392 / DSM 18658 / VKM B-2454 / MOB10) GN=Sinac_5540 PE=4 SV=1: HAMP: PAS_9: HisKA: HATPase_c [Tuwongella immobilis]VTS05875.1 multi-sensor signal transduction histidine kinase : Histidine kinase OS=Singulisphaera acidiphila (strain ATCC BAA-1392 / DSM 18658 / VKM B-2454 / MOB10) GN=Sinac_5540 PE=4 SV=1: HAMP: PAS_9: HisKA: HATPase_c [Tuwongella immobilis]